MLLLEKEDLRCWLRAGLEVTQQALEGGLVALVVVPSGEVSDVTNRTDRSAMVS